jgi:predicted lipoprotein with Yx(FWY)xxD motif
MTGLFAVTALLAVTPLFAMTGVAFAVGPTALAAAPAVAARAPKVSAPTTIIVEKTNLWGPVLALSGGWTVYRLTSDPVDKSTCSGRCAEYWPPVVLARDQKSPVGQGVGHLGTITRPGGALQVTYEGIPLYRFVGDTKAGQVNGNVKNVFGQWWVVNPARPRSVPVERAGRGGTTTTTSPFGGVAY